MSFYKYENEELTSGNYISGFDTDGNGYDLNLLDKDTYVYPYHNWYWFDTDEEAKTFFGIIDEPR